MTPMKRRFGLFSTLALAAIPALFTGLAGCASSAAAQREQEANWRLRAENTQLRKENAALREQMVDTRAQLNSSRQSTNYVILHNWLRQQQVPADQHPQILGTIGQMDANADTMKIMANRYLTTHEEPEYILIGARNRLRANHGIDPQQPQVMAGFGREINATIYLAVIAGEIKTTPDLEESVYNWCKDVNPTDPKVKELLQSFRAEHTHAQHAMVEVGS